MKTTLSGDPNQRLKVYIETDGLGHAYIQVGNTVWDYGEWNDYPNFDKIGGDGVLLKYTGTEAENYIALREQLFPNSTCVYSIYNLDAAEIQAFYEELWNNGTSVSKDSQFYNNGRIVDQFNSLFHNCSGTVLDGLQQGGAPILWSPIVVPPILNLYLLNHGYK